MSTFTVGYSENDLLYTITDCQTASAGSSDKTKCNTNEQLATSLKKTLDNYSAMKTKMDDVNQMYNREVFFTANLILGLGLLSAYFYGIHRV
jgi:hypothetical protein